MKIADMHCDTISVIWEKKEKGEDVNLRENNLHLDVLRMKEAGYILQNFALFVDQGKGRDPWEQLCALYSQYRQELAANQDLLAPALRWDDIAANERAGKISAVLTVEEGAVCRGELCRLEELYRMGVRMMTLTWNYPNELGYPNLNLLRDGVTGEDTEDFLFTPDTEQGLTERGREFVGEMERLGMIVDVSHLSDKGFYDVLECSSRPFVASHSNARGVCGVVRNLTDDMICRLGERGGCAGLNYCTDFLIAPKKGKKASPEEIMEMAVRHVRHLVNTGGIEVPGLGSDFDGIDTNEALPGVRSMELLWNALHRGGFTEGCLDKIFGSNVLRVYRECLSQKRCV